MRAAGSPRSAGLEGQPAFANDRGRLRLGAGPQPAFIYVWISEFGPARVLDQLVPTSALRLLRLGGLIGASVRLAIAPLAHERIELGAVLGRTQSLQERPKLGRLLFQLAQRLLAVLIKGVIAAGTQAVLVVSPPVLHALLPARALALPTRGRAVHPLRRPFAPPIDVTAGPMPSASHPSTPYDVGQDRQSDRPKQDEADHHEGDPCRPAEVIYACHDIRHGGFTSWVRAHVNVYNIHM